MTGDTATSGGSGQTMGQAANQAGSKIQETANQAGNKLLVPS